MSDKPKYYDIRSEFFRGYFEKALPFNEYVASGEPAHQSKWNNFSELIELTPDDRKLLSGFLREMNILVLAGTWCGDCSRQGPMLAAIAAAAPKCNLRFIDNQQHPELQDELLINGAKKVPVVVTLSEDFFEVGRFGDRHLSKYREMQQTQLGAACDAGVLPPSPEELAAELHDWVEHFERQHIMLRLAPMLRRRHND